MELIDEKIMICPKCKGDGYFDCEVFGYKINGKTYRQRIDSHVCPYCDGARVIREKIFHEKIAPITEEFFEANETKGEN